MQRYYNPEYECLILTYLENGIYSLTHFLLYIIQLFVIETLRGIFKEIFCKMFQDI